MLGVHHARFHQGPGTITTSSGSGHLQSFTPSHVLVHFFFLSPFPAYLPLLRQALVHMCAIYRLAPHK